MTKLNEIKEERIKSASEMLSIISDKLITPQNNLGFRGHIDSSWPLSPTLMRYTANTIERLDIKDSEKDLVKARLKDALYREFEKNLIINSDLPQEKVRNMDLWQYGQHFGLPTPLLDWTKSPYIALFFALGYHEKTKEQTTERCLWVLNIDFLNQLNKEVRSYLHPKLEKTLTQKIIDEQYSPVDIIVEQEQSNRRIIYQQGFFTKHVYFKSFEIWLNHIIGKLPRNSLGGPLLTKYIFSCEEKERLHLLNTLNSMNINDRTLFPDIEGSVRGAKQAAINELNKPQRLSFCWTKK